jgi:hypothetical protein
MYITVDPNNDNNKKSAALGTTQHLKTPINHSYYLLSYTAIPYRVKKGTSRDIHVMKKGSTVMGRGPFASSL